jgi:hypothetical protein
VQKIQKCTEEYCRGGYRIKQGVQEGAAWRVQGMQDGAGGCRRMPEGAEVQKRAEEYRRVQVGTVQRRSVQRVQGSTGGYMKTQEAQEAQKGTSQEVLDGPNGCRKVQEVRNDTGGCEKGSRGEERCKQEAKKKLTVK